MRNKQVGASVFGAILNRDLDLKQEPVIFAPRADAPTSIVILELIPVSLLTAKQDYLWKLAETGG